MRVIRVDRNIERRGNDVIVRDVGVIACVAKPRCEVRTKDGEKLFEGRAETETRKKDLPTTLPLLAEALFADFPGFHFG